MDSPRYREIGRAASLRGGITFRQKAKGEQLPTRLHDPLIRASIPPRRSTARIHRRPGREPAFRRRSRRQKSELPAGYLDAWQVNHDLITGGWQRLVYASGYPTGTVDRAAYVFCLLEQFHRHIKHRNIFVPRPPAGRPARSSAVRRGMGDRPRAGDERARPARATGADAHRPQRWTSPTPRWRPGWTRTPLPARPAISAGSFPQHYGDATSTSRVCPTRTRPLGRPVPSGLTNGPVSAASPLRNPPPRRQFW